MSKRSMASTVCADGAVLGTAEDHKPRNGTLARCPGVDAELRTRPSSTSVPTRSTVRSSRGRALAGEGERAMGRRAACRDGGWAATEGWWAEYGATEGRAVEGRAVEGRTTEGRAVEGRTTEGRPTEGRAEEGRATAAGGEGDGMGAKGCVVTDVPDMDGLDIHVSNGGMVPASSSRGGGDWALRMHSCSGCVMLCGWGV